MTEVAVLEPRLGWLQSWLPWLRWTPTSPGELEQAEHRLLAFSNTDSTGFYVSAGKVNGEDCWIWTRRFSPSSPTTAVPLVLLHGMGAGLALFLLNYSALATGRTVFAIDLPGFGRSSRVGFSSEPSMIEEEYLGCLEAWRTSMGLDRINLVGHSFGGHLTGLYALRYPQHLQSATLADPWGMTERPTEPADPGSSSSPPRRIPGWVRALAKVLVHFNPLWGLRAAGPAGPWLVARTRPDIIRDRV